MASKYKVYYDQSLRSIIVGGVADIFPEKSLEVEVVGDKILIKLKGNLFPVLGPVHFEDITNIVGEIFPSVEATRIYLEAQFLAISILPSAVLYEEDNWI